MIERERMRARARERARERASLRKCARFYYGVAGGQVCAGRGKLGLRCVLPMRREEHKKRIKIKNGMNDRVLTELKRA